MRFMVLVKPGNRDYENGALPKADDLQEMGRFNDELMKAGMIIALDGLQPTSKGSRIRYQGGKPTVVDGPFTETKELIGGFWPAPGWDTMDEVKANSLGWTTRSFGDLHLVHHRHTGEADGLWHGLVKYGRANYICGYHPLFMLGKCVRRLAMKPPLLGSFALMYGFVTGYLKRIPQVDDPDAIAYLRRQQLNRLMGRNSIWD